MSSYANFKIIPDKEIIIEYFAGKISLENILELKLRESQDLNYNSNFNIIDDSRDAEFLLNEQDIKLYVEHLSQSKLFVGERNAAYLTETPNQVVIATLFDVLKKELPVNVKIVSTVDAALSWVGLLNDDRKVIDFYLNLLRIENLALSVKQFKN